MNRVAIAPNEATPDFTLWETGRAVLNSDTDEHMPMIVVSTSACAGLNNALAADHIEGDIRYLYALPKTAGSLREVPPFEGAIAVSVATLRNVGMVFIAVDPQVQSDLSVALSVSHVAREAGLFVVALVAQADFLVHARMQESMLPRAFDSVIDLRTAWTNGQSLACNIIKHIAGGLRVAPPVCTDLADVQGILRGAIVTVGVGESAGPTSADEMGRGWRAAALAIEDVGFQNLAAATGVIVAIAGGHSVSLSEISRVTHQVGDLVKSADALVIPTVHFEPNAHDQVKVTLLVANRDAQCESFLRI